MHISFLLLFLCAISLHLGEADVSVLSQEDKCIANIRKEIPDRTTSRNLGGIIGIGWDSLTNEATLPVFSQTYKQCRTVPDGDFLIPDNIVVFPIKEANIQKSSEMFESFSKYKSSTGGSFSVSAGGGIPGLGSVKASMSVETKIGKEHMEKNKRTGFSNKIEYHAFDLIGNEKAGFDEVFTERLNDIVKAIKDKNFLLAQYEAESIIGDYGTHVTNRALAGASITMLGFTDSTSQEDKASFQLKMSAQMEANFMGAVSMGTKAEADTSQSSDTGSSTSSSQTYIMTKGGPDVNRLLGSDVDNKMKIDSVVGLTRNGMPIYSYIHPGVLKGGDWTPEMTFFVQDFLYNATQEYFRHNSIPGCVDGNSDSYFYKANVDDANACKGGPDQVMAYMGGYYQTCEYVKSSSGLHPDLQHGDQCDQYRHENPILNENGFKCPPSGDAESEILYSGSLFVTYKDRVFSAMPDGCNSTECSLNYTITDLINITTYVCDIGGIIDSDGDNTFYRMVFGGIFETDNIFSDTTGCSRGFKEYPILLNLKICLAFTDDDYIDKIDAEILNNGVTFGGIATCFDKDPDCFGSGYYLTTIQNCPYYLCVEIPDGNFSNSTVLPTVSRPPYVSRDLAMSKIRYHFQQEIEQEIGEQAKMLTADGKEIGKILKLPKTNRFSS